MHSARRSAIRSLWEAADLLAPPEVPAGAAEQAEQLLQEAIQVAGEGYGRQSMVFVQCLDALARFSRRQSRLEEALLLYRHQLAILDGFRAYELPMVQHRVLLLRCVGGGCGCVFCVWGVWAACREATKGMDWGGMVGGGVLEGGRRVTAKVKVTS